jgi:rhodanese-related sulfurtransferase
MAPFPLPLSEILGQWGQYVVFLLIGVAFGYVLEISGFGNSRKLAAQFYFKDMTVLKVMFTAIVVAMVLIFGAAAVGLLDYNLVWVNHTYLWPGILGGLIMGLGFIIGGFCPGTSVVSASTGKLDGLFFLGGVLFGIFAFGETVGLYENFWYSSYLGRFTLPQWLGLPTGVVVLLVVLMALFMFWGSEQLERIFGGKDPHAAPRWRYGAAAGLTALAVAGLIIGQPTPTQRWARIAPEKEAELAAREVQIHPAELLNLMHDPKVRVMMLDVRSETDYNIFHIIDAEHVPMDTLPDLVPTLNAQPSNTVFVVMSNGEEAATDAWRTLVANSVPNVYILGGGVNGWIETFAEEEFAETHALASSNPDMLRYDFDAALGARQPAAEPNPYEYDEIEYEPKVELQIKRGPIGSGCGS